MRIRLNLQEEIASNNDKQTDCINATIKIICSNKVGYFLAPEFTPCLSRRFRLSCCRHARRFLLSCFPAFWCGQPKHIHPHTTQKMHTHIQNTPTHTERMHTDTQKTRKYSHTHTPTQNRTRPTEPHKTHTHTVRQRLINVRQRLIITPRPCPA